MVQRLSETGERLRGSSSEEEAGIFLVHIEIAWDSRPTPGPRSARDLETPEAAVLAVGEECAEMFGPREQISSCLERDMSTAAAIR